MNAQMEILLQIQDLKGQRKELGEGESGRQVQQEQFNLDIDAALAELDSRTEALESELDPTVRQRYDRLARAIPRPVVPAINGTCYGCFVSVATAVAADPGERDRLRTCDHCGRFLYFVP
jgi:predicted  nucleic acid-binding Zn-ribbon protein